MVMTHSSLLNVLFSLRPYILLGKINDAIKWRIQRSLIRLLEKRKVILVIKSIHLIEIYVIKVKIMPQFCWNLEGAHQFYLLIQIYSLA